MNNLGKVGILTVLFMWLSKMLGDTVAEAHENAKGDVEEYVPGTSFKKYL